MEDQQRSCRQVHSECHLACLHTHSISLSPVERSAALQITLSTRDVKSRASQMHVKTTTINSIGLLVTERVKRYTILSTSLQALKQD